MPPARVATSPQALLPHREPLLLFLCVHAGVCLPCVRHPLPGECYGSGSISAFLFFFFLKFP